MFSQMSKFLSFGASATVWRSPHPNRSISRLSRAASMSPVTGVRLTQASDAPCPRALFGPSLDDERNVGA